MLKLSDKTKHFQLNNNYNIDCAKLKLIKYAKPK